MFETTKKKNEAIAAQQEWQKNKPAEYASTNDDTINNIINSVGTGFKWDATNRNYQNYRNESIDSANGAAEAAAATANTLSGGYDSSWANSAAQQSKNAELTSIANAMTGLRGQALTEYQNNQSNILNSLDNAVDTEELARSAYSSDLANYKNWANFLSNATQLAKSEDTNYWNNVWNTVSGVGSAILNAYDTYKGYTAQKQSAAASAYQTALSLKQAGADDAAKGVLEAYGLDSSALDSYTGTPVTKADQTSTLSTAFSLYQAGATDAAKNVLSNYGLDTSLLDSYTGNAVTTDDQISAITKAASLANSGYTDAAKYVLKAYGIDSSVLNNYALTAATSGSTGTSTGSGSTKSSSGSSKSKSSFTNSQLQTMAKQYSSMDASDPLYAFYKQTLTDAGWLQSSTSSTGSTSKSTSSNTSKLKINAGEWKMPTTSTQMAQRTAYNMAAAGKSTDSITDTLIGYGLSNKEIYDILNNL